MRFADLPLGALLRGVLALALVSCAGGFEPLSTAHTPQEVSVTAIRLDAVSVSWSPVEDEDVIGYAIERRANLTGAFVRVVDQIPQSNLGRIVWLDTDVEPETYYGYRVLAVTRFGDRSAPSVVGGTRTPSLPGIEIITQSQVASAEALDPDGYEVTLLGPDTVRATTGVSASRRFTPLRTGQYEVRIGGIIGRCALEGTAVRTVVVTDTTAVTITPVVFQLSCRDPNRGEIAVGLAVTGNDLDADFTLDLLGEASDQTLPDSLRITARTGSIALANPLTTFRDLRPGTYDVTLEDIAANCTVTGSTTRTVQVVALGIANANFAVTCIGDGPPPSTARFVWRNRWPAASAAPGTRVTLTSDLDLTADPLQKVQGVQADIFYDPAVLRFETEVAGQLPNLTVNASTPGRIGFLAATTNPRAGVVRLASFEFTVLGAQGTTAATLTTNVKAGSPTPFQADVRVEEDTLAVTGSAPVNQPPIAEANGPYAGAPGVAIAMNANGSTDADGAISSFQWNFGDSGTGSGANASHVYAAAGTYTVILTVTDDDGAATTDQASVVVTAPGGGGNTPPVAEANGPYATMVGTAIALSAAGSSDANGSIASYAWTLGNGQTATGAAPTVTYATAGTYTITLTVTDNAGATGTDQATIVVSLAPAPGQPLVWRNTFGPVDIVNDIVAITVSYDLRTNIAETPGTETLASFVVDSLKWDPSLLQFSSINLGPNVVGSSTQQEVGAGNLAFRGTVSGAQAQGLITIATIRFRIVGSTGARALTRTFLGPLQGAASTNFFVYNAKTALVEGDITLP